MNILLIHQNFPGQFVHLAADLAKDPANKVMALGMTRQPVPAGVTLRTYTMLRPSAPETHPCCKKKRPKSCTPKPAPPPPCNWPEKALCQTSSWPTQAGARHSS